MSAFDDARSLVQHAQDELPKIRQAYDESLAAKTIAPRLLVEIKNVCENLRSALDFVGAWPIRPSLHRISQKGENLFSVRNG